MLAQVGHFGVEMRTIDNMVILIPSIYVNTSPKAQDEGLPFSNPRLIRVDQRIDPSHAIGA
jgi:hypothetical protein